MLKILFLVLFALNANAFANNHLSGNSVNPLSGAPAKPLKRAAAPTGPELVTNFQNMSSRITGVACPDAEGKIAGIVEHPDVARKDRPSVQLRTWCPKDSSAKDSSFVFPEKGVGEQTDTLTPAGKYLIRDIRRAPSEDGKTDPSEVAIFDRRDEKPKFVLPGTMNVNPTSLNERFLPGCCHRCLSARRSALSAGLRSLISKPGNRRRICRARRL